MKKLIKVGSYFIVTVAFAALMIVNIHIGFEGLISNNDPSATIQTNVSQAFANPCIDELDCQNTDIYCGSITVRPAGEPSYTIVCNGGKADPQVN